MIRHFNDKNDSRLHTISWLKEHISEFNDSDIILDLRKESQSDLINALDNAPTDTELDELEEAELKAARKAFELVNQKG